MLALLFVFCAVIYAEPNFKYDLDSVAPAGDKEKTLELLKLGTGGPYTYSQASHRFFGTGFDGSHIDTSSACSGNSGPCRNNPGCQCRVSVGPLPKGKYTLGNMRVFKGMNYCYDLYPAANNSMCGRSGFLIHGGSCAANPSDGCIVIEDQNLRYKIKSGATLFVVG